MINVGNYPNINWSYTPYFTTYFLNYYIYPHLYTYIILIVTQWSFTAGFIVIHGGPMVMNGD